MNTKVCAYKEGASAWFHNLKRCCVFENKTQGRELLNQFPSDEIIKIKLQRLSRDAMITPPPQFLREGVCGYDRPIFCNPLRLP